MQLLIGTSPAFEAFQKKLRQAAATPATVLLRGESGSGKGAAARALHAWSPFASGPFVEVLLAALAPSLLEAELFGHVAGAFTGAHAARSGRFRAAHGGTLLLDDVDLLPLETQVKLLRVLQERVVEPVGAETPEKVDVRVVATTQRDLAAEVAAGRFRRDLYYRLAVVPIEVPPLRARVEDLPRLAEHLAARIAAQRKTPARALDEGAQGRLSRHPWPGNVRELENALERALVLASETRAPEEPLSAADFGFLDEALEGVAGELAARALAHGLRWSDLERALIERAMVEQRGNIAAAARQIGITRRAAEYRLARAHAEAPSEGAPAARGGPGEGEGEGEGEEAHA